MKTDIYFYHSSLISAYNKKCFRKFIEKIKTNSLRTISVFFENRDV